MKTVMKTLAVLSLLMVVASCGTQRRGGPAVPQERTTVRVQNQNFLDMTIYVLRNSQRVRLGTVGGVSTQVLTIPSNLIFGATPLRFQADPVGATRTPTSFEITVSPGDQVQLIIPN
jgi:predicted small lipoprotein YifL